MAEHVLLCADRGEREELLHCLRGRPLGSVAVAVICFFSSFDDFFHFRRGELSDFSPCFPQRFKSFSPGTAAIGFAQRAIKRKDPRAEGKKRDSDESERGGEGSKKEKRAQTTGELPKEKVHLTTEEFFKGKKRSYDRKISKVPPQYSTIGELSK